MGKAPSLAYPTHILALGSRREGLGADDGIPSKKWPWRGGTHPPVFGAHHCGGWGHAVSIGLSVHLWKKSVFTSMSLESQGPLGLLGNSITLLMTTRTDELLGLSQGWPQQLHLPE